MKSPSSPILPQFLHFSKGMASHVFEQWSNLDLLFLLFNPISAFNMSRTNSLCHSRCSTILSLLLLIMLYILFFSFALSNTSLLLTPSIREMLHLILHLILPSVLALSIALFDYLFQSSPYPEIRTGDYFTSGIFYLKSCHLHRFWYAILGIDNMVVSRCFPHHNLLSHSNLTCDSYLLMT